MPFADPDPGTDADKYLRQSMYAPDPFKETFRARVDPGLALVWCHTADATSARSECQRTCASQARRILRAVAPAMTTAARRALGARSTPPTAPITTAVRSVPIRLLTLTLTQTSTLAMTLTPTRSRNPSVHACLRNTPDWVFSITKCLCSPAVNQMATFRDVRRAASAAPPILVPGS